MKIARYKTRAGAERYAKQLAKAFPERVFKAVTAGFEYAVGVFKGPELVAYAAPATAKVLARAATQHCHYRQYC